jgi:hypothetical protein
MTHRGGSVLCDQAWGIVFAGLAGVAHAALTQQELSARSPAGAVRCVSPCVYVSKEPKAAEIAADVAGLAEVSLVTWTGGDSSTCDYADWLEARFEGDGAPVYVSDLPWEFAWTFCGDPWRCTEFYKTQARKDRSVLDTALTCGGQAFKKGFGVHAASLLVVKVPPGAKRLVATGMMDDVTATHPQGKQASAQFVVLAGLPGKEVTARLDLPQVLPPEARALVASLNGRCDPALARDYEGLWKSLLFETRVQEGCVSREVRESQACQASANVLASDRDPADIVSRRARALWADLAPTAGLKKEGKALAELEAAVQKTPVADGPARAGLYLKLCELRRKIAFANPLLKGLDKLVFVTREALPPEELNFGTHMADQYFGFHATLKGTTQGNGLYVLEKPFSDQPTVRNLLAESVVESGPRKGLKLGNGGYLAPDVSFDGKQILFCYTDGAWAFREWTEESTFHIFRCSADGSGLVQLTDGPLNDLDPCWLPSGRIAFISERRRGFGRCHPRPVPNYTLFSMFEDGTDIERLSSHETNEWQPSVDNNGMVVYTRWDYVDRGFNQAHHLWLTTPDGRDARELNGNEHRSERTAPHLIGDGRSIPNSGKYMAVAGGHHTQTRGSLIVIDPSVPDDHEMSQVRRFTPDQVLPEAEAPLKYDKASGAYATPWPLSETYTLCVYDPLANAQYGSIDWRARRYSIALVDAYGNKEVLYTHPDISCLSPMPLQARKAPPVHAHQTLVGRPRLPNGEKPELIDAARLPKTARVGVVNVYNSRYAMPEGVKIKALRVWQILPKVSPINNKPRIGLGDQKGGRQCLGTVPVEEDGSAFFEIPVNIPVMFHAVDEKGLAVQGMRSATYTAPGETLMCNGCHEQRVGVMPQKTSGTPLAMRRTPSKLVPEVAGSYPFSYPRLVQPVLDAKCGGCHGETRKEKAPDLRKGNYLADGDLFYTSVRSLGKYVHYYGAGVAWDAFTPPYTEPGKFGAYASPLYAMLSKGHHDVKLTDEELRRLVLFMESNASFLGHDHDARGQADGWIIYPVLQ